MVENIEYRGFRLSVEAQAAGWRVMIRLLEGGVSLSEVPSTDNANGRQIVIEKAKGIVDKILGGARDTKPEAPTG